MVDLSATGLPPEETLLIAFANLQSYQLLQQVTTDKDGSFATTQEVPRWAELNGAHYFFASRSDERPLAFSYAFHVTPTSGVARVSGTIGSSVDGCVDLKTPGDVLYHLIAAGMRVAGERVVVTGTIADAAVCGGAGVVVDVAEIEVR